MKASDIVSICTTIAGLGSAISEPALEAVFPGHGAYISGVLALAGIAATVVIRTLTNKTGAPASGIVADAPVVPPGTAVVPSTPDGHPTVISTSSNLLPKT